MLAARRLALAERWIQAFTDGTTRDQTALQNFSLTIKDEFGHFLPILLTTGIIPENETSDKLCHAILNAIAHKGKLLDKWKEIHESMYPGETHNIPHGSDLDLAKLAYGVVNTDTCHGARKLNQLLREEIEKLAIEKGIDSEDEQLTFQQDCHHHMRNV